MKNQVKNVLTLISVIVIFLLLPVYSSAAVHESEPNDSFATANTITENTVIKGSAYSHSQDYHDYYQFTIKKSGYINITIKHNMFDYSPINHHFGITLYRYDGSEFHKIGYIESLYSSEYNELGEKYIEASRYYIDVINPLDDILIEYELGITFSEESSATTNTTTTKQTTIRPTTKQNTTYTAPTNSSSKTPDTTKQLNSLYTTETNNYSELSQVPNNNDLTFNYNDFVYKIENSNVTIVNYIGAERSVIIPSEIDNLPVVGIAGNAFNNMTSIRVPNSVTEFGYNAFGENDNPDLIIECEKNSEAERYAIENGLNHQTVDVDVAVENNIDTSTKESSDKTKIIIAIICASAVIAVAVCVTIILTSNNNKNRNNTDNS